MRVPPGVDAPADGSPRLPSSDRDLTALPFDQYQRYRLVQEAIDALRWQPRLSVLDVGGSPGTLARFLTGDWVVVADVADQGGLDLYASGLALPFADSSFDIVVACDTLEHIPAADRPRLLAQLARVAREAVVVAAPFDDPTVNEAEEVLQQLIRARYGEGFHFIEEHREYGLPTLETIEGLLREHGFQTVVLPNGYVHRWLVALSVFFLLQWRFHDPELSARVNRYYNDSFYRADNREPSYRKVVVASRTCDISGLRASLCVEPPDGETARTLPYQTLDMLIHALTESWSERALELASRVGEQTARLEQQAAQLKKQTARLEQQAARLAEQTARLEEQTARLEDQEVRLEEQEAQLRTVLSENEGLRDELAAARRTLQEIRDSNAWRVVRRLWDVRTRAVPPASRREHLFRSTVHAARVARNEGAVPLARTVVPYPARRFLRRTIFKKKPQLHALPTSYSDEIKSAALLGATEAASGQETFLRAYPRPATYDVIVFPIIDWDFRFQRPQQIARRFARAGHRVLYVATTLHDGDQPLARPLEDNVVAVQLPGPSHTNLYTDAIDEKLRERLLAAFESLCDELDIAQATCIVDLPFWGPLALALRERYGWKVVYDCMDDYAAFSTVSRRMVRAEAALSRASDLVLATSRGIYAAQSQHNPNTLLVPNAVDFDHFHPPPPSAPEDVRNSPRPIVGYYGAISDWFDAALVGELARARPDWSFVLVGSTFGADLAPLSGRKNVYLLGEKPYAGIPAYAHAFDVCIIPFKKTPLTDATNPVKMFEYLAAGKPVVATELGELTHYREQVSLVTNKSEWLDALEAAMRPASPQVVAGRVEFARENSWDARATQIATSVEALYPLASIVIVTYNNLDYTRLCLDSIYARTVYPRFEVVVVDNASQDGTPAYLQEFAASHPNCTVILSETNDGFARGNNRGLAAARGEYVVFLNNDTVVTRGWLSRLVYHLRDPHVGMVGPVTNSAGNEARILVDYTAISDMEAFAHRYTRAHFGETFDIGVLALFCVAMRRQVVDAVGPLDERFGIGMFEDDDYALRVREEGYRIICAEDVFVHHWGSASFSKLQDSVYQALFDENLRKFEAKWGQKWQPHKYRASVAP